MPKKSDTRDKVMDAADSLLQEGIRPTQQNVRARIGSGSITTINSALNGWWLSLSDRINRKDQHPELPDPVINAANQLWDQALTYAHHSFKKERAEVESMLLKRNEESSVQLELLRTTVDQLQQQNAQLRNNIDDLNDQCLELQQKLLSHETAMIRLTSERDETNRENKQLKIIQRKKGSDNTEDSPGLRNELFEARVESKVNLIKISNLEKILELKDQELQALKQVHLSQEKTATQQQHRLELVVAQQDARYDEALKALTDCKVELSLAKK